MEYAFLTSAHKREILANYLLQLEAKHYGKELLILELRATGNGSAAAIEGARQEQELIVRAHSDIIRRLEELEPDAPG